MIGSTTKQQHQTHTKHTCTRASRMLSSQGGSACDQLSGAFKEEGHDLGFKVKVLANLCISALGKKQEAL